MVMGRLLFFVLYLFQVRLSHLLRSLEIHARAGDLQDGIPMSLIAIAPLIRVARQVESTNPRVAYLCRYYAFENASRLDPAAHGEGVLEFMSALLQCLASENNPTIRGRAKPSDAPEMDRFFRQYYYENIEALMNAGDREQLLNACETAVSLFKILKIVNQTLSLGVDPEILEMHNTAAAVITRR